VELSELYRESRTDGEQPVISIELFPPKTAAGLDNLLGHLNELVRCNPSLITCTYGAGGTTRDNTLSVLGKVQAKHPNIPVASHLTCVGSTVEELREYIEAAIARGVGTIVALRGDPPKDGGAFEPVAGGLSYGNELVAMIDKEYPELGIIVGGYPETHAEAVSPEDDIRYLRQKVDAGSDVVVTQLFYDNDAFYRFRERCDAAGISVPIIPGILPITNFAQVQRITSMCGASLPKKVLDELESAQNDEEQQFAVGIDHTTRQVQDLLAHGVPGLHFYVLNKSRATLTITERLFS
jgi:methylenetetrahydrofolate reductase (NADPH)